YNSCSGITVSGGVDACQAALAAANRILNSGYYRLADSFPQNFRADNYRSPENIFVVKFIAADGLGMDYAMAILHYNQYAPLTPWNGFAITAQTYNAFDSTDKRRQVVLIGRQRDVLTGALINDRAGNAPLVTVNRAVILRERLFELLGEGKRRQDLIRFGAYTTRLDDPSLVGGKSAPAADYYVLAPIPQTQIDANPLLCQNPGYGTATCP